MLLVAGGIERAGVQRYFDIARVDVWLVILPVLMFAVIMAELLAIFGNGLSQAD